MLLSENERANLAGLIEQNFFTERALIERATLGPDDAGGPSESWATVATDVPCARARAKERESAERAGALAETSTWRLRFPAATDLQPRDRVTIGGLVYIVTGPTNNATRALLRSVYALEQPATP